jgi:hypothetical protein
MLQNYTHKKRYIDFHGIELNSIVDLLHVKDVKHNRFGRMMSQEARMLRLKLKVLLYISLVVTNLRENYIYNKSYHANRTSRSYGMT